MDGVIRFFQGILMLFVVFLKCIPGILALMFIYGIVQFYMGLI